MRLRTFLTVLGIVFAGTVAKGASVVCSIVTPGADGLVSSQQLDRILRQTAPAIVDEARFKPSRVSEALDACKASKEMDHCVFAVLRANKSSLVSELHDSHNNGYLVMTGHATEQGVIEGTAWFFPADGEFRGVGYLLEPLDAKERPRRHYNEQIGRAEWFGADSTYLLKTDASEVARRLGLAAQHKHVRIRAFDRGNGFENGTVDWDGVAVIHAAE